MDPQKIKRWWSRWPEANIGIATGEPSGLLVIDVDHPAGYASWEKLEAQYDLLPGTLTQISGGGGSHLFFEYPDLPQGTRIKNAVSFADGLDVRATGGLIIVDPSLHGSGNEYKWDDLDVEPAPAPEWLIGLLPKLTEQKESGSTTTEPEVPIQKGQRNRSLFELGSSLRGKGLSPDAVRAALLQHNSDRCIPPLSQDEVLRIAGSVGKYMPEHNAPGAAPTGGPNLEYEAQAYGDIPFVREDLVPPKSWLQEYMNFIYPTTDAPEQFTYACGMAVLSMACREMYIQFGQARIRPNLWLAIIAPSSLYRKSTSINAGQHLINQFDEGAVLPHQMSPEAFVQQLANERSSGIFAWGEFSSQLAAFENRSYMRGYLSDLTDLYDCPETWLRRTVADGLVKVENPFINIMTVSTQDWLNQCLSEGNLKGGFLPRFMWVMAFNKDRFLDWPQAPDPQTREFLVRDLSGIHEAFRGGMTVSDEAKALYSGHAKLLETEAGLNADHEGTLGAFYSRLSIYTLKFALIYQADIQTSQGFNSVSREISVEAMQYAVNFTEYLRQSLTFLLDKITYNEDMRDRLKVLEAVRQKPGIARSELYRRSKLSKKRLDEAVATLEESELIQRQSESSKGRPTFVYFPVKLQD